MGVGLQGGHDQADLVGEQYGQERQVDECLEAHRRHLSGECRAADETVKGRRTARATAAATARSTQRRSCRTGPSRRKRRRRSRIKHFN